MPSHFPMHHRPQPHDVSLGQSRRPRLPRSRSLIMHPPLYRPNCLLLLECSRSHPQGLSPHCLYFFLFGWHTETCRVFSCRSCPYVTPHSSTCHTTIFSYLFNPFRYYRALIPLFLSGSPFRRAISPLYYHNTVNTSHDSSRSLPELRPLP